MTLAEIEARLRQRRAAELASPTSRRAAVSLVLQEHADDDVDFLLIHRAERHGDPWSGQMALPGGKHHPDDPDLVSTAIRETREEVGLDLERHARTVAPLDEIQAVSRTVAVDLIITPYVHLLESEPPALTINPGEVQGALWVPLSQLARADARTTFEYELGGRRFSFPAFAHRGYTIWGLTYRILSQFLQIVAGDERSR